MNLGDAIGPKQSKLIGGLLEDAVAKVIKEQGDSVAILKETLQAIQALTTQLNAIADQQQAASQSLADSARYLAARTVMPAPEVNVTTPEPVVNVTTPEPVVNVTTPEPVVNVTLPSPESRGGTRKRVVRDQNNFITEIIEEPL
jgi:hypothetical protein